MTRRTLRPCAGSPICPELVEGGGYCPEHNRLRERARGSSHARGYDTEHQADRIYYLQHRAPRNLDGHPVCEECGRSELDTGHPLELDHLDGLGPNGPNGHDPDNHQILCRTCHQTKTAHQTGTAGGPR